LKDYVTVANSGKSIVLCWTPSHVNIPGNERADAAAKSAIVAFISVGLKTMVHCAHHFNYQNFSLFIYFFT